MKNGNVVLEGAVDNAGDRAIAEIQANTVSGVFNVENRLGVLNDEVPAEMKKPKK